MTEGKGRDRRVPDSGEGAVSVSPQGSHPHVGLELSGHAAHGVPYPRVPAGKKASLPETGDFSPGAGAAPGPKSKVELPDLVPM